MCGIVGLLGQHEVSPLILEALKRLEYRGYDSAGVATVGPSGVLDRRRATGKLVNLSDTLVHDPLPGRTGIGHTRWATHGGPTEINAHPHRSGPVAVVHNGIIENFRDLRREVADAGLGAETQTDSEVVALLCHRHIANGLDVVAAAKATVAQLEGAFALVFLFDGEPDLLVAARQGSPLAIGWGDGEMFVGSDAIALGHLTDRITYMDEGDIAVLRRSGVDIRDVSDALVNRPVQRVQLDEIRVDKGGYQHFMAKEIAEQPAVLRDTLQAYLTDDGRSLSLGIEASVSFAELERLTLVACGTAYYACAIAKYWFERLARLPVEIDIASEFRYRNAPLPERSLTFVVSQSGETADTLAALRYVRGQDLPVGAVVNVPGSSIARECDPVLLTHAGTEIGVASTKAFTSQLMMLALLALEAGRHRGTLDAAALAGHLVNLNALPGLVNQTLTLNAEINGIATSLAEARDVLFLGRGAFFPLAMEGALKLKEISYIHAEGYASGELKHGPIALIERHVPVIVMAPRDALFEKTVSNMQEVMAREGKVVLITDAAGAKEAQEGVWRLVQIPEVDEVFAPILYALPAQLIAYHTAIAKGTDADQPRNLAKSVTVE